MAATSPWWAPPSTKSWHVKFGGSGFLPRRQNGGRPSGLWLCCFLRAPNGSGGGRAVLTPLPPRRFFIQLFHLNFSHERRRRRQQVREVHAPDPASPSGRPQHRSAVLLTLLRQERLGRITGQRHRATACRRKRRERAKGGKTLEGAQEASAFLFASKHAATQRKATCETPSTLTPFEEEEKVAYSALRLFMEPGGAGSPEGLAEVALFGGAPWGFTLKGGLEHGEALTISKVEEGGKADLASALCVGDEVVVINGIRLSGLRQEAICLVKGSHKTLRLSVRRRSDPVSRPHSWHSTKHEEDEEATGMMRISQGSASTAWHPTYHTSSSTSDLSGSYDMAGYGHHLSPDQYSSRGSMDSLDHPTQPSQHHQHLHPHHPHHNQHHPPHGSDGLLHPTSGQHHGFYPHVQQQHQQQQQHHQHVKSSSSVDSKRDSAYSSFSVSDRSGSAENVAAAPVVGCWDGTGGGGGGGGGNLSPPADLRFVRTVYGEAGSVREEPETRASRRSDIEQSSYRRCSESSRRSSGQLWQPPMKAAVSVDSVVSSPVGTPPPPPIRSVSFIATRNHEKSPSWSGPDGYLPPAVAAVAPGPPNATAPTPRPPPRGSSASNLLALSEPHPLNTVPERSPEASPVVPRKPVPSPQPAQAYPGQPLAPTGVYAAQQQQQDSRYALSVSGGTGGYGYPAVGKQCSDVYYNQPPVTAESLKPQHGRHCEDGGFGQSPPPRSYSSGGRQSLGSPSSYKNQDGAAESIVGSLRGQPLKSASMLELNQPCAAATRYYCISMNHPTQVEVAPCPPPKGEYRQWHDEAVQPLAYAYADQIRRPDSASRKRYNSSGSSSSSSSHSSQGSIAARVDLKPTSFPPTDGRPPSSSGRRQLSGGSAESGSSFDGRQSAHTDFDRGGGSFYGFAEDPRNGGGGGGGVADRLGTRNVISAERTPMLHHLTVLGAAEGSSRAAAAAATAGDPGKQVRRSDRFATTLRNEIQMKRAQLQKSKSSSQLVEEEEEEEENEAAESLTSQWKGESAKDELNSPLDAAYGEAYKEHVKEAQTKVLRATSFRRRDLEIRLPFDSSLKSRTLENSEGNHSRSSSLSNPPLTRSQLDSAFQSTESLPAHHVPRICGRKRLTDQQKKRSYSEPEKMNEVGVGSESDTSPAFGSKLRDGAFAYPEGSAALCGNSNGDRGSVADRRKFFEKDGSKMSLLQRAQAKQQQQQQLVSNSSNTKSERHDALKDGYGWYGHPELCLAKMEARRHSSSSSSSLSSSSEQQCLWRPHGEDVRPMAAYSDLSPPAYQQHAGSERKLTSAGRAQGLEQQQPYGSDLNVNDGGFGNSDHQTATGARGRERQQLQQPSWSQQAHLHQQQQQMSLEMLPPRNSEKFVSSENLTSWKADGRRHVHVRSRSSPTSEVSSKVSLHAPLPSTLTSPVSAATKKGAPPQRPPPPKFLAKRDGSEPYATSATSAGDGAGKRSPEARATEHGERRRGGPLGVSSGEPVAPPPATLEAIPGNFPLPPSSPSLPPRPSLAPAISSSPPPAPSPSLLLPPQQLTDRPPTAMDTSATPRIESFMDNNKAVKMVPVMIIRSESKDGRSHQSAAAPDSLVSTTKPEPSVVELHLTSAQNSANVERSAAETSPERASTANQEAEEELGKPEKIGESSVSAFVSFQPSRSQQQQQQQQQQVVNKEEEQRQQEDEDRKTEQLAKEIVGKDRSLADVLAPGVRTARELMEGIFPHSDPALGEALQARRKSQPRGSGAAKAASDGAERREEAVSPTALPPCPAYYSVSAPKAELLMKMKDLVPSVDDDADEEIDPDLTEKKAELIASIGRKLRTLREARELLLEDVRDNEELGREVEGSAEASCKPNELDKFRMFVGDLDKVVSLLLSLAGRLARVDNAINSLGADATAEERQSLVQKRKLLCSQHEDARELKENLDRRERAVDVILAQHLSAEQLQDYRHFVKMKSALIIERRELDDKIKLGEEQLRCLRESMPPECRAATD
ncbi:unnamed protein product [Lampetra planeri]